MGDREILGRLLGREITFVLIWKSSAPTKVCGLAWLIAHGRANLFSYIFLITIS